MYACAVSATVITTTEVSNLPKYLINCNRRQIKGLFLLQRCVHLKLKSK